MGPALLFLPVFIYFSLFFMTSYSIENEVYRIPIFFVLFIIEKISHLAIRFKLPTGLYHFYFLHTTLLINYLILMYNEMSKIIIACLVLTFFNLFVQLTVFTTQNIGLSKDLKSNQASVNVYEDQLKFTGPILAFCLHCFLPFENPFPVTGFFLLIGFQILEFIFAIV